MTTFELSRESCLRCGAELEPSGRSCAACGATVFAVEIERSLRCDGVTGNEIAAFVAASLAERRRMYDDWKQREVRATLDDDPAVCDRCGVAFKRYENEWNRAGLCSRTCRQAHLKSQLR